jgi:hypothetical protein
MHGHMTLKTRILIQVTIFRRKNKDLMDVDENTEGLFENVAKL